MAPDYDLSKVTVPTFIVHSKNDYLSTPTVINNYYFTERLLPWQKMLNFQNKMFKITFLEEGKTVMVNFLYIVKHYRKISLFFSIILNSIQ